MMFEDAPCLVDLVDIVGEDDVVGIAHRYEYSLSHPPIGQKQRFVLQYWFAHVNGDTFHLIIIYMQPQRLDSRKRQQTNLSLVLQAALIEVLAYAAAGIAAHHRLAAVGIEDAHSKVGLRHGRAVNEHQSVGADALVPVAPDLGTGVRVGNGVVHGINVDVVVATAVHLGEFYLGHDVVFSL